MNRARARAAYGTAVSIERVPGRRCLPALTLALAVASAVLTSSSAPDTATAARQIRVTVVGDSIPAALGYVATARDQLATGMDVRFDLRVCRRLATPSCRYKGTAPPSALEAIHAAGPALGDVLVIDVGYNEMPATYRDGMERIIRIAVANGVEGIVWVTLRETTGIYRSTNAAIRSEARRWPQVEVADWNSYGAGRPWFRDDGLHLNAAGAEALAAFLRPFVLRAGGGDAACKDTAPRSKPCAR